MNVSGTIRIEWNSGDKEGFTPEKGKDSSLLKCKTQQTKMKENKCGKFAYLHVFIRLVVFPKSYNTKVYSSEIGKELAAPCEQRGRTVFCHKVKGDLGSQV